MGLNLSKTPVTPVLSEEQPQVSDRKWSEQQEAIFQWFSDSGDQLQDDPLSAIGGNNLIVRARAGTGKTTTIVEGVKRAPEEFILVTSFGRKIVNELKERVVGGDVQTLHGLGNTYVRREWPGVRVVGNGFQRSEWLTEQIAKPSLVPKQIRNLITNLHTKGREMIPFGSVEELEQLALFFDYVPDESWREFNLRFVVDSAWQAMIIASTMAPTKAVGIDFADMIFLPLAWNIVAKDYELAVVDEAQDMTASQLELVTRSCSGRMCIVGDDKQAIYGFRGADTGALDRLKKELNAAELPLVTTYRCGKTIVQAAQRLVPDIQAHENNHEGAILSQRFEDFVRNVQPGDYVLSRLNAPLVRITLRLLRQGTPAYMAGRDIGKGIEAIVRRFKLAASTPVELLLERLTAWESKEITKMAANNRPDLIDGIRDKADTIRAFAENQNTVGNVLQHCERVLVNEEQLPEGNYVFCSSVHKAKGLEADRVFVLAESLYRWVGSQDDPEERNIQYVAMTRAKHLLVWVSEVPGLERKPRWSEEDV